MTPNLKKIGVSRKNRFHIIDGINWGNYGYPKTGLKENLDNGERGEHAAATSNNEGERVIAVAWRGKGDKLTSGNRNKFFM